MCSTLFSLLVLSPLFQLRRFKRVFPNRGQLRETLAPSVPLHSFFSIEGPAAILLFSWSLFWAFESLLKASSALRLFPHSLGHWGTPQWPARIVCKRLPLISTHLKATLLPPGVPFLATVGLSCTAFHSLGLGPVLLEVSLDRTYLFAFLSPLSAQFWADSPREGCFLFTRS